MSTTVAVLIYFMPSIIAFFRNRSNGMAIVLTNLFFGWTVIGWIIALVMAFRARPAGQVLRPPNGV